MWSRWFPIGAAATASALMYLSTAIGSLGAILLAFMSMLPLFLVALAKGWQAGAVAALVASVIVLLASNLPIALFFAAVFGLPVVIVSQKALLARPKDDDPTSSELEWYPAGALAMWLTALPIGSLAIAALWSGLFSDGLESLVREEVEAIFEILGPGLSEIMPYRPEQLEAIKSATVASFPGALGVQWALMILVNGVLAQGVLTRFARNLRPSPAMKDMRLPKWAPYPFAIALLAASFLGGGLGYVGWNAVPVLALPFFLSGLGVAHAAISLTPMPTVFLIALYVLLGITHWAWIAAVLAGLVDHWADLKRRLARRNSST